MNQHLESYPVSPATLYVVATPIGNLQDITYRAVSVLHSVDLIAAEDTRRTGVLLQHFHITNRVISLHDHNEEHKTESIIEQLQQGSSVALVSDAGTPLINDPGYRLVRRCHLANIQVVPLPGPCAAIAALSVAGLSADRFCYEGFLPAKSKARIDLLVNVLQETRTLIFYASTHRIINSLQDMMHVLGQERYIVLAKELTKVWETIRGGTIVDILTWLQQDETRQRGEIVLLVEGYKSDPTELSVESLKTFALLQKELPLKKAASLTAEIYGLKTKQFYNYALNVKNNNIFNNH